MVKLITTSCLVPTALFLLTATIAAVSCTSQPTSRAFTMEPIGWVHKNEGTTWIEIDRRFEDALLGLEDFSHVWVFWWFDRNDTPGQRRILQVHPRGDADNPLTGVFATRAPVRPNLIALTCCRIISIEQNRIAIANIDALDGTPVVDLKPYLPMLDEVENVRLPAWIHRTGQASRPAEMAPPSSQAITLTIVYDNNQHHPGLETAWGFACIVAGLEETILFDTGGDGRILLNNMQKMGIEPEQIDCVVLSHQHGDHTGGLSALLDRNNKVTIYAPASFPDKIKQAIKRSAAQLIEVKGPQAVCRGARSTGQMGRAIQEQALAIDTNSGTVIVTGCAHPGVVRMVRQVQLAGDSTLALVVGGFHLGSASDPELTSIIQDFKEMGVERAGPCHCSGERARQRFKEAFLENYVSVGVGSQLSFEHPTRENR